MNENNIQTQQPPKREKKKKTFNIIDFLLILIVIALVAAVIYLFLPMSTVRNFIADNSVSIQYTVEILDVEEQYLDSIAENDIVLDSVTKNNIGTVIAVESSPHTKLILVDNEDGGKNGAVSTVTGKYDIKVTINATANFTVGEGYAVNGIRIAVGEKINARFPGYVCEAYCISVPKD